MGLSCGYSSEDADGEELKTCIETAKCGTELSADADWVCDAAMRTVMSIAALLTVTAATM